jgi:uncharacterized protein involved in type VI secretion and phage assembly
MRNKYAEATHLQERRVSRIQGVVTGQVTSVNDPDGQGRVQVSLPYLGGQNQSYWAPLATMAAGSGRGSWFMPVIGDEVLIAFNQNDVAHPYVIGSLWNGQDPPPSNDPNLRVIRSVNGMEIQMYDPPVTGGDQGYIRLQFARGDGVVNVVEINNTSIVIRSDAAISIQAPMVTINDRLVAPVGGPI